MNGPICLCSAIMGICMGFRVSEKSKGEQTCNQNFLILSLLYSIPISPFPVHSLHFLLCSLCSYSTILLLIFSSQISNLCFSLSFYTPPTVCTSACHNQAVFFRVNAARCVRLFPISFHHLFSAEGEYSERAAMLLREPERPSPVGCAVWCPTATCQNHKHSGLRLPERKCRRFSHWSHSNPVSRCEGCSRRVPPVTDEKILKYVLHLKLFRFSFLDQSSHYREEIKATRWHPSIRQKCKRGINLHFSDACCTWAMGLKHKCNMNIYNPCFC